MAHRSLATVDALMSEFDYTRAAFENTIELRAAVKTALRKSHMKLWRKLSKWAQGLVSEVGTLHSLRAIAQRYEMRLDTSPCQSEYLNRFGRYAVNRDRVLEPLKSVQKIKLPPSPAAGAVWETLYSRNFGTAAGPLAARAEFRRTVQSSNAVSISP